MSKFKVGDRVRTANKDARPELSQQYDDGLEFTVTRVSGYSPGTVEHYNLNVEGTYYMGDPDDHGVWEERLELAQEGPEVEETTNETLYFQPWPGGEWITAYNEPQWYRDQGYPLKRVTIHRRVETEYLS